MSQTSIDQLVCKPNNDGKTSITFDRFLSDDNFSDDDGKSSASLEDMVKELRENEDSPFDDEKRLHLKREPSAFLFQRMAQKKMTLSTKKANNLSRFLNGSAEEESIQVAGSNGMLTIPSGLRSWSSVEFRKICSACLLLTLPSIVSVCIALLVLFLVRDNSQDGTSISSSMSPTVLATMLPQIASHPSMSPSPAPSSLTLPIASPHVAPNNEDGETTITRTLHPTTTPTEQQKQQQDVALTTMLNMDSVQQFNSSVSSETLKIVTTNQLIGLIDAPMDTDELVLLIETDSDLGITKYPKPLDISKMKEITTKGGDKLHCNIKVDGVGVSVQCRANEETCRVYLEPLVSTLCDQAEDDASSS